MAILDAFDLSGKVAVVTGGNTGLGEAFAWALSEAGASVAIAARTRDRSEAVAEEWAPHNVRVNALAPGYVKTAMAPVDEPQFRRHLDRRRPHATLRHARGARTQPRLPGERRL